MAISKVIYGNSTLMDLTADTVDASHLLSGYTAHGCDGEAVTGACTFDADTSDANAVASELLDSKTAYVNGVKVTGSMPNRGAVTGYISDVSTPYTIQNGYHDGSGFADIDPVEKAKITNTDNIKKGVVILGSTGTYDGEATPAQSKAATPYTTAQTILPDAGYLLSQVDIAAIYYNEVDNAAGGKTVTIGTVAPQ